MAPDPSKNVLQATRSGNSGEESFPASWEWFSVFWMIITCTAWEKLARWLVLMWQGPRIPKTNSGSSVKIISTHWNRVCIVGETILFWKCSMCAFISVHPMKRRWFQALWLLKNHLSVSWETVNGMKPLTVSYVEYPCAVKRYSIEHRVLYRLTEQF